MSTTTTDQVDTILFNCTVATCSPAVENKFGILTCDNHCVGICKGDIVYVGDYNKLTVTKAANCVEHDCNGYILTPGLIDCHTHVVYGGDRCGEWELKLKGATYEEVAQAGGGIVNTVEGTRSSTVDDLIQSAKPRIEAMLNQGTTCIEIKSGYGLDVDTERNMLLAATELGNIYPQMTVIRTFLGAHAVPKEYKGKADAYINVVINALEILSKEGLVDCVDAFCETVGFSVEQTERVFMKAKELNIPIRLHGDQLHDYGGASLAAKYNALSCDHCEHTSVEGVKAMASAGTVAVLLPTATYFIKEQARPPIQEFRNHHVNIALATNCNPGSSPCKLLSLDVL
jgi:imidazolonepropionase